MVKHATFRREHCRAGFALLELCTVCAALVISLGLMVSLARFVRAENGFAAFRGQLSGLRIRLEAKGKPAWVPPFAEQMTADDETRQPDVARKSARQNMLAWSATVDISSGDAIDVWGMPIVLIDDVRPSLGMAPHGRPFLMSAGPDGRYFTLLDNVYDYDIDVPAATQRVGRGGHGE